MECQYVYRPKELVSCTAQLVCKYSKQNSFETVGESKTQGDITKGTGCQDTSPRRLNKTDYKACLLYTSDAADES